ncbi:MAG: hypothetical protein K0R12_238 [Gammaproteobacteria bacterium]|jgi:4-amino-4-deoxy-L-arabinose transferase-like glycosyltransferase|nr:hypothetical protein [Gammaproteobacteria bacterium]
MNQLIAFPNLNKKQLYSWAFLIIAAHIIFWTVPALLWRTTLPLDTTEAFAYALQLQWGYDRDPYLVTFIAALVRWLTPHQPWLIYFCSQIAVLAAFAAVWRLARVMGFSALYALISVLCLEGIAYYNFSTPEFNDNILILPFWAWACFAFYQACQTQRLRYWLALGVFAGLATMAKHTGGLLVLSMLCYLLLTPKGRLQWKKSGIYLGALIAFLIILPNLIWLAKHDFATLLWATNRASLSQGYTFLRHIVNPLLFIAAQLIVGLPAFLLLAIVCGKARDPNVILDSDQWYCLLSITILPFFLALLCSILTGGELLTHWGTPFFLLMGVSVLAAWRPQISRRRLVVFIAGVFFVFCILLLSNIVELLWMPRFHHNLRAVFPAAIVAEEAQHLWDEHFPDSPLQYVDGDRWISGNISVFASTHPIALPYFYWEIPKRGTNLKVSAEQIKKSGIMIVWLTHQAEPIPHIPYEGYSKAVFLGYIPFQYERTINRQPDYINVAVLAPQDKKENS